MTKQAEKDMEDSPRTFIRDIDELKEFIKTNKEREDYFDRLIEKVISKSSR